MYQLFQDNYEDFVTLVSDVYNEITTNDEYNTVAIIARYDDAKEIVHELCDLGYYLGNIYDGFGSKAICGYSDEYIITIFENEISIEQAKVGKDYLCVEAECVFVLSNCNSKILSKVFSEISTFEVVIGEEEENCSCCGDYDTCNEDCENKCDDDWKLLTSCKKHSKKLDKKCECDKHEYVNGHKNNECTKTPSLNKYEEYYSVNGNKVSKKEYEKAVQKAFQKFGEKYLQNLQGMLNDYNDFYDEMDRFEELFRW